MEKNEILKNGNSSANQEVKSKLIHREVLACFTCEMELLLKQGWENPSEYPCYDEIENFYSYPEFSGNYFYFEGGTEDEKKEKLEEIQEKIDTFYEILDYYFEGDNDKKREKIKSIIEDLQSDYDEIENLEMEQAEILEWWAVTSYFAEKLKNYGHCVFDFGCNSYWGRETSGQAILLDYGITKIAFDMGILEGQENHNHWKN